MLCYVMLWKNNLEVAIVGETHQPENKDIHHEKYRVDNSDEFQANPLPNQGISVFLISPPDQVVPLPSLCSLSECLHVGLHQDVHEGFEETEDQPAVEHLNVGRVGEVCVDTEQQVFIKIIITVINIFLTKNVVKTSMTVTFMAMIASKEYLK